LDECSQPVITRHMTIAEVLSSHPQLSEVFSRYGMGCCACLGASTETIEQAAKACGVDVEQMVQELNVAALVGK